MKHSTRRKRMSWWVSGCVAGAIAMSLGAGFGLWTRSTPVVARGVDKEAIAAKPTLSQEEVGRRLRTAYRALEAGRAAESIEALDGLEDQWPAIADQILMMRGLAFEKALSPVSAERTWQTLLDEYPDSSLAPRALMGIGQLDTLRSRHPKHPATALALKRAAKSRPTEYVLHYDLALNHPQTKDLTPLLKSWVDARQTNLTRDEWQAIADAYWQQKEYGKASRAYANTPPTSQNLYRWARSHHISDELDRADPIFARLFSEFPNSEDAIRGRLRLALTSSNSTALSLLRQVANLDHEDAPGALLRMSKIYDRFDGGSARTTRDELIRRFPTSESAGKAAWTSAWNLAKAGQLNSAIALAERIADLQPSTEAGAQLRYWAGKWRDRLGDSAGAIANYRKTLQDAHRTYYAWRAAERLGYPVGDFGAGRIPVTLTYTPSLQELPSASATVQILHLADLPELAWQRHQWETLSTTEPTLAEEFTAGVLRNRADERLKGINQVTNLLYEPSDPDIETFKQRADFWQTVFPMHHFKMLDDSARQFGINPLLMAGLIRQESRFEPEIASYVGALGLTQVMPETGQWISGQIGQGQYDLKNPADNLRFGSFYLDYTHRRNAENSMLAVAGYNGGPHNVDKWVQRYGLADLDVFVESIPFPETRKYVKAVFGNYWNYFQLYSAEGDAIAEELGTQFPS
ncbi:MAG: transglycosylase SLT domain-containing protein [Cyanobacteria bacterium J06639_1]